MTPSERTTWVLSLSVDAYCKAVLHALAHRIDNSQSCWPSMARLAEDSGMSIRKAREVTRQLHEIGLIEVTHSQGRKSNRYTVKIGHNPAQCAELNPAPRAELDHVEPGTTRRVNGHQPGTTRHPTRHSVPREQIREQIIEQRQRTSRLRRLPFGISGSESPEKKNVNF